MHSVSTHSIVAHNMGECSAAQRWHVLPVHARRGYAWCKHAEKLLFFRASSTHLYKMLTFSQYTVQCTVSVDNLKQIKYGAWLKINNNDPTDISFKENLSPDIPRFNTIRPHDFKPTLPLLLATSSTHTFPQWVLYCYSKLNTVPLLYWRITWFMFGDVQAHRTDGVTKSTHY